VLGPLELGFVDGLWLFARWVFGLVVGEGTDLVFVLLAPDMGLFVLEWVVILVAAVVVRVAVGLGLVVVGLVVALVLRTRLRLVYHQLMVLSKLLGFFRLLLVVPVQRHPQRAESC